MSTQVSSTAINNMKWLLKREFWENKGGVFWAPVVTGLAFLGLMIMAILVAVMTANRNNININNLNLGELISKMTPEHLAHIHAATEISLYMIAGLIGTVMFVVVFFYCLSALYDDRRDRSVLFWKSLPISDGATVLSKVTIALFVAPLIAALAAIATGVGSLIVLSIYAALNGVNPFPLLWAKAAPLNVGFHLIAVLPVQALWALPTVGWLLLCSAWARSKPFLWAVLVPVAAGITVSWYGLLQSFSIPDSWFWKNVVARMLLSIVPGTWMDTSRIDDNFNGPEDFLRLLDLSNTYATLATPQLWIGAIAGIGMIVAAVYLRRRGNEA